MQIKNLKRVEGTFFENVTCQGHRLFVLVARRDCSAIPSTSVSALSLPLSMNLQKAATTGGLSRPAITTNPDNKPTSKGKIIIRVYIQRITMLFCILYNNIHSITQ